jgi:hypothetical protein
MERKIHVPSEADVSASGIDLGTDQSCESAAVFERVGWRDGQIHCFSALRPVHGRV